MNYTEAVDYIENTPKFTKKNGPENTRELLERIGHPEREMKVIHVAGTNGKGSVCAFLASILLNAGKHVGLFTSPHLVEITERFEIDGEQVSHEKFARALTRVLDVTKEMIADGFAHPAYFELLFAAGLLIFREEKVEYLVLETGLGGRLDATNLVEHPIACVITSISLDHMEYLGDTVTKIAGEKAGIIKEGVPVVYDGRNPEADAVIAKTAADMHARAYRYDASMSQILGKTDKSIDFLLDCGYDEKIKVTVPYLAPYQVVNSSLALMALRVIDPEHSISTAQAVEGIALTRWPGRMETVLPGVVLDGAHNADGIQEFIRTVQSVQGKTRLPADGESEREQPRRITLLFSAVSDKEYGKMIREICEGIQLSAVVVTQVGGSRVVPAERLAEAFRSCLGGCSGTSTADHGTDEGPAPRADANPQIPVLVEKDVREAFETALRLKGDGMLFCAGSLYLVGELKAILKEKPALLFTAAL
ncbi:MAG: bifunctional folylpolyglutamate synthase/dihydrofolate synthase [Lachnospiraceae bacterium]|nr:bifunctional folylpolyglutamate synthase/dihydrofolate synthase [Lachnospiraceae bacterium]